LKSDDVNQLMRLMGEFSQHGVLNAETKRHTDNLDLFEAMLRETYDDVTAVIAGHHIMFTRKGRSVPIEIPSADFLIFNHTVAKAVWGDEWEEALTQLALDPVPSRDILLRNMYEGRSK
jgi:hypothetical protein